MAIIFFSKIKTKFLFNLLCFSIPTFFVKYLLFEVSFGFRELRYLSILSAPQTQVRCLYFVLLPFVVNHLVQFTVVRVLKNRIGYWVWVGIYF